MKHVLLYFLAFFLAFKTVSQTVSSCSVTQLKNLMADSHDELLVINFWATFCKPCVQELPHFIKVCNSHKNVRLMLVSLDAAAMFPQKISAFARRHHIKAEIKWLNETDANYFCPAIDPNWNGTIPATLFINNKNGKRNFTESEMNEEELKLKITEMLD